MQYTIRNIPPDVDRALKARARKQGKSVNQVAIEALSESVGRPVRRRSLREMPGGWSRQEAAAFDRSLERERRIEPEIWK